MILFAAESGGFPRAHKFAVIGDEAVHAKCGDEFWRKLADVMSGYFRKGEFTPGIIHGVQKAGDLLAEHFHVSPAGGLTAAGFACPRWNRA